MDRVVKPQCLRDVQLALNNGLHDNTPHGQRVPISWENWMAWTDPYQGQRTATKPGAPPVTPLMPPPARLAIPQGVEDTFASPELLKPVKPPTQ
jgi:hypothetical protein